MKKKLIVGALVASLTITVAATPAYAAVASWGLDRIDGAIDGSYSVPYTGAGVTAYVLDTGVNFNDTGFGGRASGDLDCHGHGTHVAGIIGSSQFGVAPGAKIVSIKVASCSGGVVSKDLVAGIDRVIAMNKGPAVANISITIGKDSAVDAAIERLYKAGILPVVAASNWNTDACKYSPSGVGNAFTVSGINKNDQRTTNASWGDCVDIFAPGGLIDSEDWQRPDAYKTMTGTSMATPHVVGVAALYLEKNPKATPAQVAYSLKNGALAGAVIDAKSANGNYLLNTSFLSSSLPAPVLDVPQVATPVVYEIPAKPSSPSGTLANPGYKIVWKAPANADKAGIIGYKVEYSTNNKSWSTTTTTGLETSLLIKASGYYKVTAIGQAGLSLTSLTSRVTIK